MLGDLIGNITNYLFMIPSALIALTFHEASHGYAAYLLGDPTAKIHGRLSLNPLRHLDPIGSLCMIFFRFGWAKPVPVNTRFFKNQKLGMALTAAAGPIANFVLAFISLFIGCLAEMLIMKNPPNTISGYYLASAVILLFQYFHIYNLSFAVFNLIPLPPFDGSRIFLSFLPEKLYFNVMRYERYIMIGFLVILWTGIIKLPLASIVEAITKGMLFVINLIL